MKQERIYYWDNLKCLLIFLVVLGHFLIPVYKEGESLRVTFYFIYLFHMPAFIFVSGYFSKSYLKKEVPVVNKLIGFLLLYVIYKILLWGLAGIMQGEFPKFQLFVEAGAPWYLFAMFVWYLILPFLAKLKAGICIGATILLGLYIGMVDEIGPLFCLSRIIVFLPFFMTGYYFSEKNVEKMLRLRNKIIAVFVLLTGAIVVLIKSDYIKSVEALIYGNRPYSIMSKIPTMEAIGARLCLYLMAFAMIFSIMCLIPKRKLFISYIGSRTLAIYMIHCLIRNVFVNLNVYDKLGVNGIELLLICVIVSALVTWIASPKIFHTIFNKVLTISYKKLLKDDGGENE